MKARQLDVSDYTVKVKAEEEPKVKADQNGNLSCECPAWTKNRECRHTQAVAAGEPVPPFVDLPYDMKESLIELLLSRDNALSGRELLARDDLARKINECPDGTMLVDQSDWDKMVTSIETVKGLGRPDVEFARRILEAPEVDVEEKKDTQESEQSPAEA